MVTRKFQLVEFLTIIVIIAIATMMLLPLIFMARQKERYQKFCAKYGTEVYTLKEFNALCNDKEKSVEILGITNGTVDPANTKHFKHLVGKLNSGSSVFNAKEDLYDRWAAFSGNPKKLTRQEFNALASDDLIKELKYDYWRTATGNPKNLSREEFECLKNKGLITFKTPASKANSENW